MKQPKGPRLPPSLVGLLDEIAEYGRQLIEQEKAKAAPGAKKKARKKKPGPGQPGLS